jgi:hypothetical protein
MPACDGCGCGGGGDGDGNCDCDCEDARSGSGFMASPWPRWERAAVLVLVLAGTHRRTSAALSPQPALLSCCRRTPLPARDAPRLLATSAHSASRHLRSPTLTPTEAWRTLRSVTVLLRWSNSRLAAASRWLSQSPRDVSRRLISWTDLITYRSNSLAVLASPRRHLAHHLPQSLHTALLHYCILHTPYCILRTARCTLHAD